MKKNAIVTMNELASLLSSANKSVWVSTQDMPGCDLLTHNADTDVCVVGAGIAGLTTAYLLGKAGKSVILLDDGPLASGETQVTTAHLSNAIDDRITNIERWHGIEGAHLAVQSHAAAIDQIERIATELEIDCDFRRVNGYLFLAPGDSEENLLAECAAARRASLNAEMIPRAPFGSYDTGPCLRFPNQARFHPLKYLARLSEAIKSQGGQIFTNSHCDTIEGGDECQVVVGGKTVKAKAVVVATNTPINDMFAIHTKQAPYMTYVIGARIPRGSIADGLYWDTLHAYHYVRLQECDETHDWLIVGGEDHKSGQSRDSDQCHERLRTWAEGRFPIGEIEFTWGGQCMETMDGLAFIGRNPLDKENIYIATGDSGMGITHGTIAGMLLTDLITQRANPWERLYEPSRKTLRAASSFAKENLNVAMQYTDWLTPGDIESVDKIEWNSGAIVRRGMTKIAASRDDYGKLTELSAVCPHLGCIVGWNKAERTWDCPCHGSRFAANGGCINGPANIDLASAKT
jgi:glycine/D-amino acid oxidase-like deaminating enzyme/nitrite reductase/ring-hydroxylating ferredoxin subunit